MNWRICQDRYARGGYFIGCDRYCWVRLVRFSGYGRYTFQGTGGTLSGYGRVHSYPPSCTSCTHHVYPKKGNQFWKKGDQFPEICYLFVELVTFFGYNFKGTTGTTVPHARALPSYPVPHARTLPSYPVILYLMLAPCHRTLYLLHAPYHRTLYLLHAPYHRTLYPYQPVAAFQKP